MERTDPGREGAAPTQVHPGNREVLEVRLDAVVCLLVLSVRVDKIKHKIHSVIILFPNTATTVKQIFNFKTSARGCGEHDMRSFTC